MKTLKNMGYKVVVIRHPMPYGDLVKQRLQRFETLADLDKHQCTVEEREDYEPHLEMGAIVYSGVDYQDIIDSAEKEADIVIWDGGNNDYPFYVPSKHIVIVDPHRVGHGLSYYPGETNVRLADIVIISKVNTADPENVKKIRENVRGINQHAQIIESEMKILQQKMNRTLLGKRCWSSRIDPH